jgi:DeoR/GlpR family transcriptional regulator of sugar metabolism
MRVLLDNGTTTLELADILVEYDDLTVVTPSLAVASLLQFADGVQTILLGGFLRRGRPELTGLITESVLDMLAVDLAFQGADGIGIDGTLYTDDPRVAQVDRRIRERAEQTIVLADAGKIGRSGLIVHGHLRDVAGLITAPAPPPPVREALAAIVDLTVAEPVDP